MFFRSVFGQRRKRVTDAAWHGIFESWCAPVLTEVTHSSITWPQRARETGGRERRGAAAPTTAAGRLPEPEAELRAPPQPWLARAEPGRGRLGGRPRPADRVGGGWHPRQPQRAGGAGGRVGQAALRPR